MSLGFFEKEKTHRPITAADLPKCGECGLKSGCVNPMMPVSGSGKSRVLIVLPRPHGIDDRANKWITGGRRSILEGGLKSAGLTWDDVWLTGATICGSDEKADPKQIDFCRPNIMKTMAELDPDVVVLAGQAPIRSVIQPTWIKSISNYDPWIYGGWNIPSHFYNRWICPTYDPTYVRDQEANGKPSAPVADLWFREHLFQIKKLIGTRPFDVDPPDYTKQVEVIRDSDEAAYRIRRFLSSTKPATIDIETNRLKPDHNGSKIRSCAVHCSGEVVSYLWEGGAIDATLELMRSDVPKIGANSKFEDRWFGVLYNTHYNNLIFDTMLVAHCLDNRGTKSDDEKSPGLSSVKFQGYVRLGVTWSGKMDAYFESGDDGWNRVFDAPVEDLLIYNGMDVLIEHKIAVLQRKESGI